MEVGAHAADKGARGVDHDAEGGSVGWGGVVDEGDAGLADVFEADDDFGFSA